MNPFVIDGQTYPHIHVVSLKRNFAVLDGPNAGRNLSGTMIRDIIGTYYNYSMEVDGDEKYPAEYDSFYEKISAPVRSHSMTFPYGQSTLTFDAYVSNGSDNLEYMGDHNRWGTLSFNFVAMAPKRR